MHKKMSELDDSYWSFNCPDLEIRHKTFLESHMKSGSYEIVGLKFICPPHIYHPNEFGSTRFTLRGLFSQLQQLGHQVLEMGTGSGAIGLSLAKTGREVTMLDIDPLAVECAKNNALLNKIPVKIYQSDLFTAVNGKQYDLIVFNTPLMDKKMEEPLEVIACDPQGELFMRFMHEAKNYLTSNGQVCVNVSNMGNRKAILKGLSHYDHSIVYAEHYGDTNEWRWFLSAKPLQQ